MLYLKDLRKSLPENCLFDKGKVGCGGTTMAIESPDDYVICVPFLSLIENKEAQYRDSEGYGGRLYVVTGDTDPDSMDLRSLPEGTGIKVLTTYDSLGKVTGMLESGRYRLLVDEYHLLFNQYSFRSEAVRCVLDNFRKYRSFCFMTATPLEEDFILDELKGIPLVRQEWEDAADVRIEAVKCRNVLNSVVRMTNMFLDGELEGNAYFFVNSLNFIDRVFERVDRLDEDNCKLIYSKSNRSLMPISRGDLLGSPRKITFLTSTAFEGSDIYDEKGKIIVVSDPSYANTLIDISTSIQQICGRIRDSRYRDRIWHLYDTTRYGDMSYEEFKASCDRVLVYAKVMVDAANTVPPDIRERMGRTFDQLYAVTGNDGKIYIDMNRYRIDLFNFKVVRGIYMCRTSLAGEYVRTRKRVVCREDSGSPEASAVTAGMTFRSAIRDIEKTGHILQRYRRRWPFIEQAVEVLGISRIKSLKYRQKDIIRELEVRSSPSLEYRIAKRLYGKLQAGTFYSAAELKSLIQSVYDSLEVPDTAKGTDIRKYYVVKDARRKEGDVLVRGFYLLSRVFSRVAVS